jgi:hypothetical protein
VIFSAFPEFRFMDAMMADLSKKLNPGGNVSIADQVCYTKGHVNYNAKGGFDNEVLSVLHVKA